MAFNPEFQPKSFDAEGNQRRLEEEFYFNYDASTLVDPETNRGRVVAINEVAPISEQGEELPCRVFDILVEDPYIAADPKSYQQVKDHFTHVELTMLQDGFNLMNDRTEATSRKRQNKYTNAFLADPEIAAIQVWRDLVPTAQALSPLTNPMAKRTDLSGTSVDNLISNRKGEVARITQKASAYLRFGDDPIGIRDRGVAFEQIAVDHLAGSETGSSKKWLSLASGTAEPSILAAKRASEADQIKIDLTVADFDAESLKFVESNAFKSGFEGEIKTIEQDITVPNISDVLAEKTGDQEYEVVEAMGFEEYLPQDGDELGAKTRDFLPQASEFTRRAYDMVKPGGILMSGNMILNREQLAFVFGIIDWPIINARSEKSIMRVYKEAGIVDDPNASIEMYRVKNATSGTHVYNIVKVIKQA